MRQFLFIVSAFLCAISTNAQNPVSWTYTAKKTGDKTYEIRLTATVAKPWHIYSMTTPDEGPLPTKISFKINPLVTTTGKIKEVGKLVEKREEVFDVNVKYFDRNAEFVQVVKLRAGVKTSISGTVEFMACNDSQCLPPKTVNFSVMLE